MMLTDYKALLFVTRCWEKTEHRGTSRYITTRTAKRSIVEKVPLR